MALKNYTTDIPAGRTVGEIQEMLADHGAVSFYTKNEGREPVQIAFVLREGDGEQAYALEANVDGVLRILTRQQREGKIRGTIMPREQAVRVAWRILRDWIAAQLAIVESGQMTDIEAFLAWAQIGPGRKLLDVVKDRGLLALPPGREERA